MSWVGQVVDLEAGWIVGNASLINSCLSVHWPEVWLLSSTQCKLYTEKSTAERKQKSGYHYQKSRWWQQPKLPTFVAYPGWPLKAISSLQTSHSTFSWSVLRVHIRSIAAMTFLELLGTFTKTNYSVHKNTLSLKCHTKCNEMAAYGIAIYTRKLQWILTCK